VSLKAASELTDDYCVE